MLEWDINWLAALVSVVAYQVLGFLWYGPLFGNMWLQAMGKTREDVSGASQAIMISVVASIVAVIALAVLVATTGADAADGAVLGGLVGIGFIATSEITRAAYQQTNSTLVMLYVIYQILSFIVMGLILGAWR